MKIIRENIASPFGWLQIGTKLDYTGKYYTGYESGTSEVVGIFIEKYQDANAQYDIIPVIAELKNKKLICIGYLKNNNFAISYNFLNNKTYIQQNKK